MKCELYDFICRNGANEVQQWIKSLQPPLRAKLNQKLDMLSMSGEELFPHVLTDAGAPGILKIRVQGGVKLRPLLCRGPVAVGREYTILMGAKEVGDKWSPSGAPEKAGQMKQELLADINGRRVKHERVN